MKIRRNFSLENHNTLGLKSTVDEYVDALDVDDLIEAFSLSGPVTFLGSGSNVVLREHIEGRIVTYQNDEIRIDRLDDFAYRVTAGASVDWHELVRRTLGQGIAGLENLALIPGSVGAAPFQNIGAYGRDLSEVLESLTVLDLQSFHVRTLKNAQCGFGYRTSTFKDESRGRYVILDVSFLLGQHRLETSYKDVASLVNGIHHSRLTSTQIAEYVIAVRRWKLPDPRRVGNVGSFFKNPVVSSSRFEEIDQRQGLQTIPSEDGVKLSAAQLIEACGWRGFRDGPVEVWPRQPLVLVNLGGATVDQVLDLAKTITESVSTRFDVTLELEPIVVQ